MFDVDLAIAHCTLKRVFGKWFWALTGCTVAVIFIISGLEGPDQNLQLIDNRDQIISAINFIGLLLVIAVCATEIPKDVSSNIILMLLARPISRYNIVLGKFLGIFLLGAVFVAVTSFFSIISLWFYGLSPDAILLKGLILAFFRNMVIVAISLVFATCLSEIPTMIFSLAFVALSHAIPYLRPLFSSQGLPRYVKFIIGFFLHLIPNLSDFSFPDIDLMNAAQGGSFSIRFHSLADTLPPTWGHFTLACLYALMYTLFLLSASVLFFRRRIIK
ncbi:MAG: ABC transporter permease [Planctomycetota bacterium]|jgi:ABC-type transport system involved in multi-copper enzyme maturation permease subunit